MRWLKVVLNKNSVSLQAQQLIHLNAQNGEKLPTSAEQEYLKASMGEAEVIPKGWGRMHENCRWQAEKYHLSVSI